jgi:hypothetical protein
MLHTGAMSEQHPAFPPPTTPATPTASPASGALAHPVALGAAAFAVGAIVASVLGVAVAVLGYAVFGSDCSANDGWCELGAVLLGLLGGVVVGAIGYIVAGVMIITRNRPSGARAANIVVHLLIPIAIFLALALLGAILN